MQLKWQETANFYKFSYEEQSSNVSEPELWKHALQNNHYQNKRLMISKTLKYGAKLSNLWSIKTNFKFFIIDLIMKRPWDIAGSAH